MYNLKFTTPKKVDTIRGPKLLSTATPTKEFWAAWREDKAALRVNGYSCGKNPNTGAWEVCLWEEFKKEEREVKAVKSRLSETEIDIPAPEGLEYLPYQKAGIAYVLKAFGVIN